MPDLELFIIYNNSTSFLGKIGYGFRRLSTTAEHTSACAASDLTHGGSQEHEKPEWQAAKKLIPANVQQLHYDHIPADLKKYVEKSHYEYPCIVGRGSDGRYRMLMDESDIVPVSDDTTKFLKVLEVKVKQAGLPWATKPTAAA